MGSDESLMVRFKLFPRRRASLGELLGISQAEHQVSRKYHLRIVRDPMSQFNNTERRAGYHGPLIQLAGLLRRLFH